MADSSVSITAGSGTPLDTLTAGGEHLQKMAAMLSTYGVVTEADILIPKFASIATSGSGDQAIVSLVSGKKIRVLNAYIVAAGTVTVKWRSGTTDISGPIPLVSTGGLVWPAAPCGWWETAAGAALNLNLSANIVVGGGITYIEV